MNWQALIQIVLKVFEKNPQLAEQLINLLLNLFVNNPPLLHKAVEAGLAQASVSKQMKKIALFLFSFYFSSLHQQYRSL